MDKKSNELLCEVEEAIEAPEFLYTPPVQSADTLFHFVDKLEYLLPVIEKFAIIPRYCTENIDYLQIGMNKIAYPMLCFCDINLHKMQDHISFYGGYGIAFSKKFLLFFVFMIKRTRLCSSISEFMLAIANLQVKIIRHYCPIIFIHPAV